ncbi:hemerythrin hhe cation binding domain-containing protein [Paraphaeosphaeria sporulosa]
MLVQSIHHHHHHDTEEQQFFPEIEQIAGIVGLMEANVEQHRAFTPGFEAFDLTPNGANLRTTMGGN